MEWEYKIDRFELTTETLNQINLFGITIKKGITYYTIKDNNIKNNLDYNLILNKYNDYSTLDKKGIEKRCEYLNKYDIAKKYIIVKDANDFYWVFIKYCYENTGIIDKHGVWYIKLTKLIENKFIDEFFQSVDFLKTGCKTIKKAKEILNKLYTLQEKNKKSKIFIIVD